MGATVVTMSDSGGFLRAPGKASNADGVAVSSLEQSQNAMRLSWSLEEVDQRLRQIITDIHARCLADGSGDGAKVDYLKGSNLAGFKKWPERCWPMGRCERSFGTRPFTPEALPLPLPLTRPSKLSP